MQWYQPVRKRHLKRPFEHDMVWYGMVWYGMVWYGMVWYYMTWHDVMWCDVTRWYGMLPIVCAVLLLCAILRRVLTVSN